MAGDDDEMFITTSLNVTPKTTEQHLIARSDNPVTYATNNKKLRSTFCTVEDSIAWPLCEVCDRAYTCCPG